MAGALMLWALGPVVLMIIHALAEHLRLTGADGLVGGDQLQYLAWARDSGRHGLAANLFDPSPSGHVFAQPMFWLTGMLWRAGLALPAAYLWWKPVAALVLFTGAAAWTARLVPERRARLAALGLALFLFTPAASLAAWAHLGSVSDRNSLLALAGELFPAGELWGYLPSAVAVGLLPLTLLACERLHDRAPSARRRWSLRTGAAGAALLTAWLHPWQGVVLFLVLVGLLVWSRGRDAWTLLGISLAALIPLGYYLLLSHVDPAWKLAAHNELVPHLPAAPLLVGLVPLLLLAAAGLRRPGPDVAERALVLWIPAALITYVAVDAYPTHALESLSLPLAVLCVRGWQRFRLATALAAATLVLVTIPGMVYLVHRFAEIGGSPIQQLYVRSGDAQALDWLAGPAPGGTVLARTLVAVGVPSLTGRTVWVGHQFWSRDYPQRSQAADALFAGKLRPALARTFVTLTGARLVLADCGSRARLASVLAPLLGSVHRFGCATVYAIRASSSAH